MSKVIFKYSVPIDDQWHQIVMPTSAEIVHVGSQDEGAVACWAEIEERDALVTGSLLFRVFGTGQTVTTDATYVGTTQWTTALVWHLYSKPNVAPKGFVVIDDEPRVLDVKDSAKEAPEGCYAQHNDGDCHWGSCPQLLDGEPRATGRHCPRDTGKEGTDL